MDNEKIQVINLAEYKAPIINESTREDWVEYGEDNNYFQFFQTKLAVRLRINYQKTCREPSISFHSLLVDPHAHECHMKHFQSN